MHSIKNLISLKATLAVAVLIVICSQFVPSPLGANPADTGNYYEYGPFRAYYDSAQ